MARPRRLPAFPYVGCQRYFLTICTHERVQRFTSDDDVRLVHEQILKAATEEEFELTAYCYMPDHWHTLVTGLTESADLQRFGNSAKQRSGWHFSRARKQQLWQHGYYERVLRDDETTPAVIEYIVNNPVRAKLANRPLDYLYWGSSRYSRKELLEFIGRTERWRP